MVEGGEEVFGVGSYLGLHCTLGLLTNLTKIESGQEVLGVGIICQRALDPGLTLHARVADQC